MRCVPGHAVYNAADIVVMSDEVICCSVVCSTLVGVPVVYVRIGSGVLMTCCMQCVMSVSTVCSLVMLCH